ncbi:hypothetical protein [Mesorhizobium sp. A623]
MVGTFKATKYGGYQEAESTIILSDNNSALSDAVYDVNNSGYYNIIKFVNGQLYMYNPMIPNGYLYDSSSNPIFSETYGLYLSFSGSTNQVGFGGGALHDELIGGSGNDDLNGFGDADWRRRH